MLTFIKLNYKIGDVIEVTCTEGVVKGQMEFVNDRMIVLRQPNGQICGIASGDVHSFRAETPESVVLPPALAADGEVADLLESVGKDSLPHAVDESPQADDTPVLTDGIATNVVEPKVVGHIDLDKLQRIDPSLGRRKYFRKYGESSEPEAARGGLDDRGDEAASQQPYVGAKGRITFYHHEKRYGFIRDFESDNDLYFYVQQVADPSLYENLRKGIKVVYSTARNAQGLVARCVHLPHTVKDLLLMAEDQLDKHRYQLAQDMTEHVLEVDPDNLGAQDLLKSVRESMPEPKVREEAEADPDSYNPHVVYSQAKKAYLAKNYEQAEQLYNQAIQANEKAESCVKDLVTLYVSKFKQAETDAEREEARQKAMSFLEAHRQLLPDNLTTKQFLALNYHLPLLDFARFIDVVNDILEQPQVAEVVSRKVFYLWQKGIALNKMGRPDEALEVVKQGLDLAPRSRQLLNLQRQILSPEEAGSEEDADGTPSVETETAAAEAADEQGDAPSAVEPTAEA